MNRTLRGGYSIRFRPGFHNLQEPLFCTENPHLDKVQADPENVPDFPVGKILKVAEDNGHPVFLGEKGDGFFDEHPLLHLHGYVGGVLQMPGVTISDDGAGGNFMHRYDFTSFQSAVFVYADVFRNAVDPGGELLLRIVPPEESKHPQERLLGQFGRQVLVPEKLICKVEYPVLVGGYKFREGVPIPLLNPYRKVSIISVRIG